MRIPSLSKTAILVAVLLLVPIRAISEAGNEAVDLEIVLAIDASGSVSPGEFRLQMRGIGAALRDHDIHNAIASGPLGRIAVAVMVWADGTLPKDKTAWHIIESPAEALALADLIEAHPRRVSGGTGIGDGIAYAMQMIARNHIEGLRAVIDVSGDGKETPPREITTILLPQARAMAVARNVTVNGLAILTDVPELDIWYRDNVTAGPGSFVMKADGFEDFAAAMKQKMLREIAVRVGQLHPGAGPRPPRSMVSAR